MHMWYVVYHRYPADLKSFTHSGMKGVWDRERAGQRMKLKEPEWKRLLSLQGNKAATWEKLIGVMRTVSTMSHFPCNLLTSNI